jgi:hypothetical protein
MDIGDCSVSVGWDFGPGTGSGGCAAAFLKEYLLR